MKNKKLILLLALVIATLLVLTFLTFKPMAARFGNRTIEGRILRSQALEARICTMDVPSSSCGGYDVTVRLPDGTQQVFRAPGWDERSGAERAERISADIGKAQELDKNVVITVDKAGVIQEVEL